MNLEVLPNEILLYLFNYLDGSDLLNGFSNLNNRFNFLLYKWYRNYRFEFDSVSKSQFDRVCEDHFPYIADHVISVNLSDGVYTPGQISSFICSVSSFSQLINLRSLGIRWLRSYDILMKIIDECHSLFHLTDLNFNFCSLQNDGINFQLIINNIWSLPNLVHCNFNIEMKGEEFFCMPTIISRSLKDLSIYGSKVKLNELNQLFVYTPFIKRLSICAVSYINDNYIQSPLPTLIELNINSCYLSDISKMIILLKKIPNLRRLYINLMSNLIDGYQWEEIIHHSMTKLKVFRLTMTNRFFSEGVMEKRVDRLINSFRSSFWINEHQWFVRCIIQKRTIHLYTLSNNSNYFQEILYDSWKSTYPIDNPKNFLDIKINAIYNETFFEQTIPSYINLSNIEVLWIKFPINNQFWSIVTNLKRLRSLKVSSYTDRYQSQLQTLLDRTINLDDLTIDRDTSLSNHISVFKYTNASIRRLHLLNYKHCFTDTECILFSYSPLAKNCQILSIIVNSYQCIIRLIQNMTKLKALHVKCQYEKSFKASSLIENDANKYYYQKIEINDQILQWLKSRLPSKCSIVRNGDSLDNISIWI